MNRREWLGLAATPLGAPALFRGPLAAAAPPTATPGCLVRGAGGRLAEWLERFRVKAAPEARYVTAEGRDDPHPGKPDFEHSLLLDDVLRRSILALEMNGERLPAIHGGPVRLVTPGFYGT